MPASDQGVNQGRRRYQVIPRTLTFVTCGQQVLLMQGAPTKRLWANLYNGLGGHVEQGEDFLSSARRELAEEAGLQDVDLHLVGIVHVEASAETGIAIFVFRGSVAQAESLPPSDEGTLAWVNIADLDSLPLVEDLWVLLPKVLSASDEGAIFFGHSRYVTDAAGAEKLVMTFSP